jgi:Beta-galactosidase/beta-glucuronidase
MIPTTVLSALVKNGVYKDIFLADNFAKIPAEPFAVPWWFRTEFDVPAVPGRGRAVLEFDGINYRADIWLNGKKIADTSQIYGAFRQFRLDVTDGIRPGARNALAVMILPVEPGALTMGFVDWNPKAPDSNMGIWRPVRLRLTGDLVVHSPFVQTRLDLKTLKEARLTVSAEIENKAGEPREGTLNGRIGDIRFSRPVALAAHEKKNGRGDAGGLSPARDPRSPRLVDARSGDARALHLEPGSGPRRTGLRRGVDAVRHPRDRR